MEVRLTWSKATSQWIIRFNTGEDDEWHDDSYYPVKDVNPETECGWVSELLITRLYELQDLGYKISLY